MKKKTQLIVSITGITIIILALISFTYGYYLTKIDGNESSKSIQVETGIPGVLYTDLTEEDTEVIIEPGTTITKLFKVTNTGNTSAKYSIFLVDVINNFVRTEDVTYNLYRIGNTETFPTNYSGCVAQTEENVNSMDCLTIVNNAEFPTTVSAIKANEVITTPNTYYTYAMVITYINHPTINQDADQGHTFGGKINLRPTDSETNPFSEGSLAYNVINNVKNSNLEGKSVFIENLSATNMVENITTASDKILSTANDDYTASTGNQSYYFRGNPIDNYVEFAGMCWRIVRIQGDGSIKLILASELSCSEENLTNDSGLATDGARGVKGTILSAHYGYKKIGNYKINDYINSSEDNSTSARTQLNAWLDRKITDEEQEKYLKSDSWCIGDLTNAYSYDDTGEIVGNIDEMISNKESFEYTAGNKYWVTKTPSYICETTGKDGEVDTNKIGMLTFDEIVYAGGGNSLNSNYYLNNNATENYWWALSPDYFDIASSYDFSFIVNVGGKIGNDYVDNSYHGLRVAVSLKSGSVITEGVGTQEKPYVIG